jgi:outer membrane protein OmpA-like peptidoglycan-associated protein
LYRSQVCRDNILKTNRKTTSIIPLGNGSLRPHKPETLTQKKENTVRTNYILASLLLAISLPASVLAAGKYHWVDSNGDVVRDGSGECVIALYHGAAFPGCEGAEPAPAPMDSDNDGVVDDMDQCPGTAAGMHVDAKGCAMPMDSDGDGITDAKDRCANTPANTPVDAQGCTLDSDMDGVADNADRCPGTPSGSTVDGKGCAQKIVISNLNFASNSAELNAESQAVLDKIATSILSNPAIERITVTGFSDDRGAADYNKALSERRAKSVADYLVSKGLDSAKVSSNGMGEADPIADNATATGRRENRRVEIGLK